MLIELDLPSTGIGLEGLEFFLVLMHGFVDADASLDDVFFLDGPSLTATDSCVIQKDEIRLVNNMIDMLDE